ncbi:MAG: CvpA family protein, partial [Gillisia sp.]|nr:CvpA family protein [Gillisia sp.]
FLTKVANFAALGILNKLIGAGFGFLKIAFIASVIIMFFASTNENVNLVDKETLEESVLFSPIKTIAPIFLPSILREAKDLDIMEDDLET